MEIPKPLKVVFLFYPALYSKFCQDRDHLPQRKPGKLRSPAEGSLSFLVSLNSEQDSSPSDQVPNSLGQVTPLFLCDFMKKLIVCAIHTDAHRLAHGFASNFNLASPIIDCFYPPSFVITSTSTRPSVPSTI